MNGDVAGWSRGIAQGLVVLLLSTACAGVGDPVPGAPAHDRERGFANTNPEFAFPSSWTVNAFRARRLWEALVGGQTVTLPRVANDGRALRENGAEPTVTWVGHSTLLIQLDGVNVLTDPHWSERASPFSFIGPRRLSAPGLAFENLPPIHLVPISHDHYDQLDAPTVTRLAATHRPLFLVPLGRRADRRAAPAARGGGAPVGPGPRSRVGLPARRDAIVVTAALTPSSASTERAGPPGPAGRDRGRWR